MKENIKNIIIFLIWKRYAKYLVNNIFWRLFLIRINKNITNIFWYLYKTNISRIQIDITYNCNLSCPSCTRSCSQVKDDISMTISQIEKFINESILINKKWEVIDIMWWEPTIHPDFYEIIDKIYKYKISHNPDVKIRILSNWTWIVVNNILNWLKYKEIEIVRSEKTKEVFDNFCLFNVAPVDLELFKNSDFKNWCLVTSARWIWLNSYWFYPCWTWSSIDRIFGFDIWIKEIPKNTKEIQEQMRIFCSFCGFFHRRAKHLWTFEAKDLNRKSKTWVEAYSKFDKSKPNLTKY